MIISASPSQARALHAFVLAALNLDDLGVAIAPVPFTTANLVWSERNAPVAGGLYGMIREVSHVPLGPPEAMRETINPNAGPPTEVHRRYTRVISDWTVSLQVVSRLSDSAPALADSAPRILQRVAMRVESDLSTPMRAIGCAWRRSGQILPLPRIARGAQWETRAAVDLTFAVGEYIVESPGWIDSMAGTSTLSPLPAEAVTADHNDDLDDLL